MRSLTVRGGTLALPGGRVEGDLQIIDGRIGAIGVVERDVGERIDARGLLVMPGVIDPQVHFREPGATHKEELFTGSRACAAGGVTAFLEMPNTRPATTTRALLADKLARASERSLVDYGFFIGATAHNLDELNAADAACGIKIFMGSSTGDLLVSERADLERIFANGRRLIAVHAEDEARLEANKRAFAGRSDVAVHSEIRDAEAARLATALAVELSIRYRRRLHVLHMSTKEEAALIREVRDKAPITCEVTPQHLTLNAPEIYEALGTRAQMNPPLRTRDHSEALWQALRDGVVDCIATDHAPHTLEEKAAPYGQAPSGMPGVETALPVMLDAAHRGLCSVDEVVRWMCAGPARCYGIAGKGRLEVGYDGDLALVDLAEARTVGPPYLTKVGWSPFEGRRLVGWPRVTIVRGRVVFRDGAVVEGEAGAPIRFTGGS